MNEYANGTICKKCGDKYGNHRAHDDACPTKKQIYRNHNGGKMYPARFCWFKKFAPWQ